MAGQSSAVTESVPPNILRRAVAAGAIGNFVEWYDFAIYGSLAPVIAVNFFPSENPTASLLNTFAVFAVAFFLRPVGGVLFGVIGDKAGRRNTLVSVILLMSAGTTLIGILPTYATLGVLAPLLLVIARCIQGLSAGGEYAGASAFVVEYAPSDRRGFYSSLLSVSTFSAFYLRSIIERLIRYALLGRFRQLGVENSVHYCGTTGPNRPLPQAESGRYTCISGPGATRTC